ncbi:MAG: hypothetical protein LPK02_07240 [Rhodobacterales bacterium]|nr:hypothetical protein [Rhodobacterales bacterium]
MSNLKEHESEQARITAECEAGECDHPSCKVLHDHEYMNEVVDRSAPRWAWDLIDETLEMDTQSKAFDFALRVQISNALIAMRECCEQGYDHYTQAQAEEDSQVY